MANLKFKNFTKEDFLQVPQNEFERRACKEISHFRAYITYATLYLLNMIWTRDRTYCLFESDMDDEMAPHQHCYKTLAKCREHEMKNAVTFVCACGRQFLTKENLHKHWSAIATGEKMKKDDRNEVHKFKANIDFPKDLGKRTGQKKILQGDYYIVDPFCWMSFQQDNNFKTGVFIPPTLCKKVDHPFKTSHPLFPYVAIPQNLTNPIYPPITSPCPSVLEAENLFQLVENESSNLPSTSSCQLNIVFPPTPTFNPRPIDLSNTPSNPSPNSLGQDTVALAMASTFGSKTIDLANGNSHSIVSNLNKRKAPIVPHKGVGETGQKKVCADSL